MKHRVAAIKSRLAAMDSGGEDRDQRLLHLLEAVERKFSSLQQENQVLRLAEAAARDEVRQLRSLLQDVLNVAESEPAIDPGLPRQDLENLIARLNHIAATAAPAPKKAAAGLDR